MASLSWDMQAILKEIEASEKRMKDELKKSRDSSSGAKALLSHLNLRVNGPA